MLLPCIIGLDGTTLSSGEVEAIRQFRPAGFILFSRNIADVEQTRQLTTRLRELCDYTPIIAIDQEGGRVVRTAALGLNLPSAGQLAHSGNPGYIQQAALITAESLLYLGINTDFAPVLDISHDESVANALPGRCWGNTPESVIQNADMFSANLNHYGIVSCGKHFPGMGRAESDPHADLPSINLTEKEMNESELRPFIALAHKMPSLMVAHILLPAMDAKYPASLSPAIITQLLRNRLGYKGVVFTDDLCMGAISERYGIAEAAAMSLEAGCDLPLICHNSLEYIEDFDRIHSRDNDFAEKDRSKRISKLTSKLKPPLKQDPDRWNRIIAEAEALCKQVGSNSPTLPDSPVANY